VTLQGLGTTLGAQHVTSRALPATKKKHVISNYLLIINGEEGDPDMGLLFVVAFALLVYVWVPRTRPLYATWMYSWMAPPSRSRRMTVMSVF
jgi:hypothetical protein